jgi:hypothetical protein
MKKEITFLVLAWAIGVVTGILMGMDEGQDAQLSMTTVRDELVAEGWLKPAASPGAIVKCSAVKE